MDIKTQADETLIRMVADSDAMAYEELDLRWRRLLTGFISLKVHNLTDAEDLAQTVLVKAWECAGQYNQASGTFKAWIKRMAVNAIVDHVRRSGRKKRGGGMAHAELQEELVIDREREESRIDFGQLQQLVQSLPVGQRRAIIGLMNEHSVSEMESKTELTRSKIQRLRSAAIERMRDSICEREGGEITIRVDAVTETKRVQQTLF